ncbi:hypothetical protein SMSP2_00553 [Limihaloglobus sulfuriphilus]|uniref:Uncharacterized protein n=1 Tax=Limihaloglobus sulfuriphilus TaxID=1851148 RepID=A0A1Q2MC27_9BACT|nr:hypothetical protein SMSP2_00553 [Limihaloglobus sulfuriphilus]
MNKFCQRQFLFVLVGGLWFLPNINLKSLDMPRPDVIIII